MMEILLLSGSTVSPAFDDLFLRISADARVIYQRPDTEEMKPHLDVFPWFENLETMIREVDLVITHAGAGNVFELLEIGSKPFIVVPNTQRSDKHQTELAWFLKNKDLCPVVSPDQLNTLNLIELFQLASRRNFKRYVPEPFTGYDFVFEFVFESIEE